jgi:anti-sigma B factor antagonist
MRIDQRMHDDIVIIEPRGRLTVETEAFFTDTIHRLVDAGRTRLVLNMEGVPFIDCRGLGAVADAYTAARDRGGDLKLVNLSPRSRRMFAVTQLLTALTVYDSEEDAERSFSPTWHLLPTTITEAMAFFFPV